MERLRVVIYCRVSTVAQDNERQVVDLTEYASKCNYKVVKILQEKMSGVKASNLTVRKEVMKMAKARDIDAVLVTELTRWGRSTVDLVSTVNELSSHNVALIAQNGFTFDVSTSHGKLILGVMATLAEFEKDLFRERVKSGVALARANGKKFGRLEGSKADKHRTVIEKLFNEGKSLSEIASELRLSKSTVNRQIQKIKDI